MIVISSCLGGFCCRYDGNNNTIPALEELLEKEQAIAICPEVLGGLPTPRTPAEIIGGDGFDVWSNKARVMTKTGEDVTEVFKQGAKTAYEKIKEGEFDCFVLKANSPSCGSCKIYDGTFSGQKKAGVGVATAYFIEQGLNVVSEEAWLKSRGGH